jgi:hypothetical protein
MGPGDEVICVDSRWQCPCCGITTTATSIRPEIGKHYIVKHVGEGFCMNCLLPLPAMQPAGQYLPADGAWPLEWFRPLKYDEDKNVADAGVRLPVKITEPV